MKTSPARTRALPPIPESITLTITLPARVGPALRSVVEEMSMRLGERIRTPALYATEQAMTDAAIALGALRASVNMAVSREHPFYNSGGAK